MNNNKIIKEIEEKGVLECVIQNYQDMTKEQLKTIFKEFFYVVDNYCGDEGELVCQLKDAWGIEE